MLGFVFSTIRTQIETFLFLRPFLSFLEAKNQSFSNPFKNTLPSNSQSQPPPQKKKKKEVEKIRTSWWFQPISKIMEIKLGIIFPRLVSEKPQPPLSFVQTKLQYIQPPQKK